MLDLSHLIEDPNTNAVCSFCGETIDGPVETYGHTQMHTKCYRQFGEELDCSTVGDDELDYAYQRYYGFGHAPTPRVGLY